MLEMGEHATSSAPRRRWDLLSKAFEELKTGCSTSEKQPDTLRIVNNAATTRRFHGFGLFSREDVVIDGEQWIRVTSRKDFAIEGYAATAYSAGEEHAGSDTVGTSSGSFELFLRKEAAVCLTDLTGFDNTGNICIWPAEEVMAFWCLGNPSLFRGKRICELGGGMASLGGNVVSIFAGNIFARVFLTSRSAVFHSNSPTQPWSSHWCSDSLHDAS
ncbi:hypothetical protein RvY_05429-2 [Ramazzottius varieornatus]|uniref:Calmodulin-lysine N-methyltransferase n=1 Tax=Ramazzottius varieornatus TaxID=947166 RepID=A0A1D1V4S4_RAMVA|nr:hypothetical protein RvY_05429-2 [Ramazzottius varieornatus]